MARAFASAHLAVLLVFRPDADIVFKAFLDVLTAWAAVASRGRGVKNLLNRRGVMGGGFRILPLLIWLSAMLSVSSRTDISTVLDRVCRVGVPSMLVLIRAQLAPLVVVACGENDVVDLRQSCSSLWSHWKINVCSFLDWL